MATVATPCDQVRLSLSARLDNEEAPLASTEVTAHLLSCHGCADHAVFLEDLHRRLRVMPAEVVPDLTASIRAAMPGGIEPVDQRRRDLRWVLGLTGFVQLVVASPGVILPMSGVHAGREVAMLYVALGLALVVTALRPMRLAAGLLMVMALVAVLGLGGAVVDLTSGLTRPLAELVHLLPVIGALLLWLLDRQGASPLARTGFA